MSKVVQNNDSALSQNELIYKVDFLHMMWLRIHKYICIRFNLFIWVWSDESDGHGHVKSNFQH